MTDLTELEMKADTEARHAHRELVEAYEAKLAKAEASLEKLARLGNGDRYGNSEGNLIARTTLAELKGENRG